MEHIYLYWLCDDGDYIVFGSYGPQGAWVEYTRWLIPGTQLEDAA